MHLHYVEHMPETAHMTVTAAAKELGVSRWTVLRLIDRGELIAEKLGSNTAPWLVSRADVERRISRKANAA